MTRQKITLAKVLELFVSGPPLRASDIVSAKDLARRIPGVHIPFLKTLDGQLISVTRLPDRAVYWFWSEDMNQEETQKPVPLQKEYKQEWGLWDGKEWAMSTHPSPLSNKSPRPKLFATREEAETYRTFKSITYKNHRAEPYAGLPSGGPAPRIPESSKEVWGLFREDRQQWLSLPGHVSRERSEFVSAAEARHWAEHYKVEPEWKPKLIPDAPP